MGYLEIAGYIGALFIGISLGLIGGGGSILTVPLLVYFFGIEPILATAYSLFIVGLSSLFGGFKYAKQGLVDFKVGILFSIPAFTAVYLTRRFLVPALPDDWFAIGSLTITKEIGILSLFALLMITAAYSMIKDKSQESQSFSSGASFNIPLIILEGVVVGTLTGLVGAGGGFLIIPALVLLAKLPMKKAIGTSLIIISIKSLIGFIGDIQAGEAINWVFLCVITGLATMGIVIGLIFRKRVNNEQLKTGFGYFVLIMGLIMIVKELFLQ